MLASILQQPILCILAILAVALAYSLIITADQYRLVRLTSLVASLVALLVGVASCLSFNKSSGFQFLYDLPLIPAYELSFTLGADGISMVFLLLTLFVFPICFLAS